MKKSVKQNGKFTIQYGIMFIKKKLLLIMHTALGYNVCMNKRCGKNAELLVLKQTVDCLVRTSNRYSKKG